MALKKEEDLGERVRVVMGVWVVGVVVVFVGVVLGSSSSE